jgi:hypothetical protein
MKDKIINFFDKNRSCISGFLLCYSLIITTLLIIKKDTKYIVIEESSIGFVPRNTITKKYDLEVELKSFVNVGLFKRYYFTPESAQGQIEDFFKLCSKKVEESLRKNISDNNLLLAIKNQKISQAFNSSEPFKWAKEKGALIVKVKGERTLTRENVIEKRENIQISFLIRIKTRDSINPYRFYIDGINEEVVR